MWRANQILRGGGGEYPVKSGLREIGNNPVKEDSGRKVTETAGMSRAAR
jgi:hypothetical protein